MEAGFVRVGRKPMSLEKMTDLMYVEPPDRNVVECDDV